MSGKEESPEVRYDGVCREAFRRLRRLHNQVKQRGRPVRTQYTIVSVCFLLLPRLTKGSDINKDIRQGFRVCRLTSRDA